MTKREMLTALKREIESRLSGEALAAMLAATADAEDADARLASLTAQIATAEGTLADIRATAEKENLERRERIAAARATIERAETEARERAQALERDLTQRLTEQRAQSAADLAAVKEQTEQEVATIRATLAEERGLLAQLKAAVEQARQGIAPFMGGTRG